MIYLPDTNALSAFLTGRDASLVQRMTAEFANLKLSVIVVAERGYGIIHHPSGHRYRQRYEELLKLLPCEAFTHDDAIHYASIRSNLERRGQGIGPFDTLIAAQALRLGATLVTHNVREFSRVPGLKIEDWQTV